MANVWVKSGTVRNMFAGAGTTTTGASNGIYKDSPKASFQAVVSGSGAVTATIDIQYSNDGANWCATPGGTITLSGTDVDSDGFTSDSPWKFARANVTALTGTNAVVQVFVGV